LIDWNKIRKEFEETDITAKALADKYGIKPSTLRSRKNREGWKRNATRGATDNDNVATQRNATDKPGGQRNNQNAKGNSGGSAPPDNKNAVTHGLFANWLPDETRQIIQELYTSNPADIIWNNIMIQYTAIIRSQRIMNVRDEFDNTSNITRVDINPMLVDPKTNEPAKTSEQREWHMALDKQATFLQAQSRAMGTLMNLIKQFVSLADEKDERRLKLETMKSKIKILEAKAHEDDVEDDDQDDGFLNALESEGGELWPDEQNE